MTDSNRNARTTAINSKREQTVDSTEEMALDDAIELTFPASDPIAPANITRVEVPDASQSLTRTGSALANIDLNQIKIAVLVTDGFEQAELLEPKKALEAAGATVDIISDKIGHVQGFQHTEKGATVSVDKSLDEASADDYAAVLLPGGVVNGDAMRTLPMARKFVQEIDQANKPIASICHGGWLLISAGIAADRIVTSWPSLQDDFRNAGAIWEDKEVVCDENFISSRKPTDIPAFNKAFISLLGAQQ